MQQDEELKEYNLDTYDDRSAEDEEKPGTGSLGHNDILHIRLWNIFQR